jgi:hypothetical protein
MLEPFRQLDGILHNAVRYVTIDPTINGISDNL